MTVRIMRRENIEYHHIGLRVYHNNDAAVKFPRKTRDESTLLRHKGETSERIHYHCTVFVRLKASSLEMSRTLIISPSSYESLAIRAGPSDFPEGENEVLEKQFMQERFGFKNARGLIAYSKDSDYKDLYIYFDAADKKSPRNIAATTAFKCYGLDGAQNIMDWDFIHGDCLVVRAEPPTFNEFISFAGVSGAAKNVASEYVFKRDISVQEMASTLLFFKAQDKDARAIAQERDMRRTMSRMTAGFGSLPSPTYFGTDVKAGTGHGAAATEMCALAGCSGSSNLKHCSRCKKIAYCSKECQKLDWKAHKHVCVEAL